MSALESPLQALDLSFGLFTVVNNIWTWLAVMTAAFSFWRIKTSSALLKPALVRGDVSDDSTPSPSRTAFVPPSDHVETEAADELASTTIAAPTTISPCPVLHRVDSTKGRFTAYYKKDDVIGPCDDDVDCRDSTDKEDNGESRISSSQWVQSSILMCNDHWYQSWEKVIRTKKGEIGWYSYQDLHVIDGNVVRLWEGCRRRREAEATAFMGGVVRTW